MLLYFIGVDVDVDVDVLFSVLVLYCDNLGVLCCAGKRIGMK
jgi:hypothetical protein